MFDRMTKKDISRMEEEIEHRRLVVRQEALKDVKEARAHGDLSENFEYKAAKQFKNKNESRIRYLEKMIRTATIIEEECDPDVVGLNSLVTIYVQEDQMEEIYKIVTTVRSNSLKSNISIESPLGKALLGHKKGDVVTIKINDSYSYEVKILKTEYVGDDGTDTLCQY